MTELLFVYGTLCSGFDNDWARALRQNGLCLGKASVSGAIFRVDHFPAYRPEPAGTVYGELFEVPESLFNLLDEYEGSWFTRVPTALADGREAWIYQFNAELPASSRIESGEFTPE